MDDNISNIFPNLIHPISYPKGESEASLMKLLSGFSLEGAPSDEFVNYLSEDFKRFVYTLGLVPKPVKGATLLEIGSNPYFTSILIRKFTKYITSYTNFFDVNSGMSQQACSNEETGERVVFEYANNNVDLDEIPFENKFDVILFCEVLEHLINDPMKALLRIKKALKQDGYLILTTPNVNRLENISKMLSGANIYDPYSGYGPYGRHNREYNKHELFSLLQHLGFEIEVMFSSDVHGNSSSDHFPVKSFSEILELVPGRSLDLGQYIFIKAKNVSVSKTERPAWLYRSFQNSSL